jgi:SAM-dependent methyltransferase
MTAADGEVLVWGVEGERSEATITDQFKADAEEYHRRYAASDAFERLIRRAVEITGAPTPARPMILDLGSGSGVNSIVPCSRIFPGARMVATDLSAELLAMLAVYARQGELRDQVLCVQMDAMGEHVTPGAFDLVTGASILHHLDKPQAGLAAAARALKPGGHAIFLEPFNGWSIVRLAYERILAEAELRGDPLDPLAAEALRLTVTDIAERSLSGRSPESIAALDDKWIFSRSEIQAMASDVGFADVRFVPNPDNPSLYRNRTAVQLRLATGRPDLALPVWANEILDAFDAAVNVQTKRELMLEGTIVLTKGG